MAFSVFRFFRSDSYEVSFFRITKWILRLLGCWPLDALNRITKLKIVFNLTLLMVSIVGEIRFAWFLRRDPLNALDVMLTCLTKIVTWIKLACFLIYRKDLALVLKGLFEHCKTDTHNFEKNSLIAKASNFVNKCCLLLFINALSTSFLFAVRPLINWGYQFCMNGERNNWVTLPYQAALPYEDMTQINNKTFYALIYCFLAHTGFITTFGISGNDGSFLCFCMYISASYQCLHADFKRTFRAHTSTSKGVDAASNDALYEKLTELVRRQQKLIQFFKSFNRIYEYILFMHFVSASLTLAILLVNLILADGVVKFVYLLYALGLGNHLLACCYGAESVNMSCLQLSEVLYFDCDWYKCNKKVKLLILFALDKSQRGSPIKAPFFSPSMQLFASIIQTSGSYCTILQTVL